MSVVVADEAVGVVVVVGTPFVSTTLLPHAEAMSASPTSRTKMRYCNAVPFHAFSLL